MDWEWRGKREREKRTAWNGKDLGMDSDLTGTLSVFSHLTPFHSIHFILLPHSLIWRSPNDLRVKRIYERIPTKGEIRLENQPDIASNEVRRAEKWMNRVVLLSSISSMSLSSECSRLLSSDRIFSLCGKGNTNVHFPLFSLSLRKWTFTFIWLFMLRNKVNVRCKKAKRVWWR